MSPPAPKSAAAARGRATGSGCSGTIGDACLGLEVLRGGYPDLAADASRRAGGAVPAARAAHRAGAAPRRDRACDERRVGRAARRSRPYLRGLRCRRDGARGGAAAVAGGRAPSPRSSPTSRCGSRPAATITNCCSPRRPRPTPRSQACRRELGLRLTAIGTIAAGRGSGSSMGRARRSRSSAPAIVISDGAAGRRGLTAAAGVDASRHRHFAAFRSRARAGTIDALRGKPASMVRVVTLLFMLCLVACSTVPSTGPLRDELIDQAGSDGHRQFDVVTIDDRVVSALKAQPRAALPRALQEIRAAPGNADCGRRRCWR